MCVTSINELKRFVLETEERDIDERFLQHIDKLKCVTEHFSLKVSKYYLSKINWKDPSDPLRRIVTPDLKELEGFQSDGEMDVSKEHVYKAVPGCEHKYRDTALLLASDVCAGFCRFCFRKRLFIDSSDEVRRHVKEGIKYIQKHPEITNVLISGGDPFMLNFSELQKIIEKLIDIPHIRIIRIGTKAIAYNPERFFNPEILSLLKIFKTGIKKFYVVTNFNHPRELTSEAISAAKLLQLNGAILLNQTPILKGVNSDTGTLRDLMEELSFNGIPPYYVFICRPVKANTMFLIPIEEAYNTFESARKSCSGLAKRARLIMSHEEGKMEIVGLDESYIYMKVHRSPDPRKIGKLMAFPRNPRAFWLDDYRPR